MRFNPDWNDQFFLEWLEALPTEDQLRGAYLDLEAHRAALWTPGHIASYRRDRYDIDAQDVRRLVQVKAALAREWLRTGQVTDTALNPQPA